ncbi:MAG TPA: hypothetical protein VFY14_17135 [Streptomyces sp.]|nr:hypothetical protein [Streptomyces sp.]
MRRVTRRPIRRLTRTAATLTAGLAAALLLAGAGTAVADDASPSPSPGSESDDGAGPTEAGTTFRTATAIVPGQRATAVASMGDYLYWVFPAGAGQTATVRATVTLPDSTTRHGATTWRLDVHDGLRRHQSCTAGRQSRAASQQAESVTLTCRLRTVRPWAEPWSNDPLPGAYYVRLTAVRMPEQDLGLPIRTEVEVTAAKAGGARAQGGELAAPLLPAVGAGATGQDIPARDSGDDEDVDPGAGTRTPRLALEEPESGWNGGWWSDRWIWTVAGGVLGALAAVAGYTLTRRPR